MDRGCSRSTIRLGEIERANTPWLRDWCPHMGFPLHRGTVKDGSIVIHAGRLYQQMSA
jgi:hypothetical protein